MKTFKTFLLEDQHVQPLLDVAVGFGCNIEDCDKNLVNAESIVVSALSQMGFDMKKRLLTVKSQQTDYITIETPFKNRSEMVLTNDFAGEQRFASLVNQYISQSFPQLKLHWSSVKAIYHTPLPDHPKVSDMSVVLYPTEHHLDFTGFDKCFGEDCIVRVLNEAVVGANGLEDVFKVKGNLQLEFEKHPRWTKIVYDHLKDHQSWSECAEALFNAGCKDFI